MSTKTKVLLSIGGDRGRNACGMKRAVQAAQIWLGDYGVIYPRKSPTETGKAYLTTLMGMIKQYMLDRLYAPSSLQRTWVKFYKEPKGTRFNHSRYIYDGMGWGIIKRTKLNVHGKIQSIPVFCYDYILCNFDFLLNHTSNHSKTPPSDGATHSDSPVPSIPASPSPSTC